MFLVFCIAMTALAIAAVAWPYLTSGAAPAPAADIAVYRDQLNELDRDLKAGLIGADEAEAARIEISRRLLEAGERPDPAPRQEPSRMRGALTIFASLLLFTAGTGGLYLHLGSPGMATDRPAAAAAPLPAQDGSVDRLVAQVEGYLNQNPRDARGWEALAPVYMQVGRYSDSARAWRNVILLSGETAERLTSLGEALVAEANGIVTTDAKSEFTRARELDPSSVGARYYLALSAQQDGRLNEAAALYRALLSDAPAGAHWVAQVRSAIAKIEKQPPAAAAATQSAPESGDSQDAMIRGMVEKLAARLASDGSDPDGWARLVRSYSVLKQTDKAQDAIAGARRALAGDREKLAAFETLLKGETEKASEPAAAPPSAAGAPSAEHDPEAMVRRLAERLKQSASNPEGWLMLTRSYLTLGQTDKAAAAIREARRALANEPDKLDRYNEALRAFKIEDGEAGK
jgi:cytochrome c-type biogenesis protein CcmH